MDISGVCSVRVSFLRELCDVVISILLKGSCMNERVLKWLKANKGKVFASPRNEVSKRQKQDFELLGIVDDRVKIRFVGSKHPALPLYFWMFDRTLKYLLENKGRPVRLGSKLTPPYDPDTVEGQIWKLPYPTGKASYKAAPHVCDILALAGLVEYLMVFNPETRRKVQGVKLLDNR